MKRKHANLDEVFIRRCIALSEEALKKGDKPFGCVIVKNGNVLVEASNDSENRVNHHAEILALNRAQDILKTTDLSDCTLYSNCEPCPMCSFMIRELKIGRVVFSLPSPFMGGLSKWNILGDREELRKLQPFFGEPPEIVSGVLEKEAKKVFDTTPLWMFGSAARKEQKLRMFAQSILRKETEIRKVMEKLHLSEKDVVRAYVAYDLDINSYGNEIYESVSLRVALFMHYFLEGSWHQQRQKTILEMIQEAKPNTLVDMGFGVPSEYVKRYVLKQKKKLVLIDLYESAFQFAQV